MFRSAAETTARQLASALAADPQTETDRQIIDSFYGLDKFEIKQVREAAKRLHLDIRYW